MAEAADSLVFQTDPQPEQQSDPETEGISEEELKEQIVPHIESMLQDGVDPNDAIEVALTYWNEQHGEDTDDPYEAITKEDIQHWFKKKSE